MSVVEFRAWIDFYAVEPWGDYRADLRAGVISQTLVRMLGAKGVRPKPLDFMPIVAAQMARAREREGDPQGELKAALLQGFKGRLKTVKLRGITL